MPGLRRRGGIQCTRGTFPVFNTKKAHFSFPRLSSLLWSRAYMTMMLPWLTGAVLWSLSFQHQRGREEGSCLLGIKICCLPCFFPNSLFKSHLHDNETETGWQQIAFLFVLDQTQAQTNISLAFPLLPLVWHGLAFIKINGKSTFKGIVRENLQPLDNCLWNGLWHPSRLWQGAGGQTSSRGYKAEEVYSY